MIQTFSSTLQNFIQTNNLDISIVELNDLGLGSRFDSEHYLKEYIDIVFKIGGEKLGKFEEKIIHPTEIVREYTNKGVTFMRTQNLRPFFLDFSNEVFISDEQSTGMNKSKLKYGDILMTRTGANFGDTWIFQNERSSIVASSHILILRLKEINPFFITVYFNTNYGRKMINRGRYGAVQPEIAPSYLREIFIPLPSESFQEKIASLVQEAHKQRELSKSLYGEAEKILLDELGLSHWKPSEENIAVKNSDEVNLFGRCDAEFFQPKYDEIIEKIKTFPYKTIAELSSVVGHPSNPPYSDDLNKNEKTYILTQKHLGEFYPRDNFWEDEDALFTTDDFLIDNEKYILQQNDLILYSVGAYIGKTNIYNSPVKSIIGSFLTLIRPKKEAINPYYFMMFMNSWIGLELTRRNQRGLAQQYIYPYDIREQVIPILSESIQSLISSKIIASHSAHETSKKLLEQAKRAVEIFIEEDEVSAEKFF